MRPTINAKVLLVSDDPESAQIWAFALRQIGLEASAVGSADEALHYWANSTFDLTIIDVCSQRLDGIELCRRLKAEAMVPSPILLFTNSGAEPDIIQAYKVGLDEYIAKPVGPAVFLAKVMAWLRRSWIAQVESLDSLQVGDIHLDTTRRNIVKPDGSVAKLTNLEFRVLHLLMSHPGQVLENDVTLDRVWGFVGAGNSALLKNVVYRLRRKIEVAPSQPRYLHTVAGEGYVFRPG